MASANASLSEDEFRCSICLGVFSQPVAIPCGHNFCKSCISKYWDIKDVCDCPMCKRPFSTRPELFVNTFISEMAAKFQRSAKIEAPSSDSIQQNTARPPEVPCDVCSGIKLNALKSCSVCLASYCETHLEPHLRVAALKRHKLMEPVADLEDRLCKRHNKTLELFCRSDQTCVCIMCMQTDHKGHDVVILEKENQVRRVQMAYGRAKAQQKIEERKEKIQQIKRSVEQSDTAAETETVEAVKVFTALVAAVQRNQADFIETIELKKRAVKHQAKPLIEELEREIFELQMCSSELERLSVTEDHLRLIQDFPSTFAFPRVRNWSEVSVHSDLNMEAVRTTVAQLGNTLDKEMEKLPEVRLKRVRQRYAVDVTLDPKTAHPRLILSKDGKQVSLGDQEKPLLDNPERFDTFYCVLGKEGFFSKGFYFEVQVKGNSSWSLGVVRESISRKGECIDPKFWLLRLKGGENYSSRSDTITPLHLRTKPQKIGVFLDYEKGQVSFYDADTVSLLTCFKGCKFTEKLYPLLSSGRPEGAPLIITPLC